MAPQPLPKKLGLNATVSAKLNLVKPVSFWKEIYPNNYRDHRIQFNVEGIEKKNDKYQILLLCPLHPDKTFYAAPSSVKIVKTGPPNQLFRNDAPSESTVEENVNVQEENEDGREDREPLEDGALDQNTPDGEIGTADDYAFPTLAPPNADASTTVDGPSRDGNWSWTEFSQEILTDERGSAANYNPSLCYGHPIQLKYWKAINFSNYFIPWKCFENHVLPATNQAMEESGIENGITLSKLKMFMGLWFLMSLHPQYSFQEFFYQDPKKEKKKAGDKKRKRDEFWDPPKCGKFMSRN